MVSYSYHKEAFAQKIQQENWQKTSPVFFGEHPNNITTKPNFISHREIQIKTIMWHNYIPAE